VVGTKHIPAPDRGPETVVTHVFINHSCNYEPAWSHSVDRSYQSVMSVTEIPLYLVGNYLIGKHTIQNYKRKYCILAMMTVNKFEAYVATTELYEK